MFTAYAAGFASFEQSGLAELGDTFVLIIVIVIWAYFSGLILTMGAIISLLHERIHRKPELLSRFLGSEITVSSVSEAIEARELDEE